MNESALVFATEFARKVRSRIYLLATFGGAVFIALIVLSPVIFASVAKNKTNAIVLAGTPALRTRAAVALRRDFVIVATADALPPVVDRAYLDHEHGAAAAVAVTTRSGHLHLEVYARDLALYDDIQFRSLVPLNIELGAGIPSARVLALTRIDRTLHGIDKKFANSRSAGFAHAFAFGLILLLYFAIILASQSVMSAVAEEKTSRIAEILVATISPVNLLTGKTLAAAALAVLQIAVWACAALVVLPVSAIALGVIPSGTSGLSGGAAETAAFGIAPGSLDPVALVAFAVFFVLGYLQFATLYAAAASLVSRTEDLSSVTTPIVMPAIGAFLVAQYAIVAPDSPIVVAASFVPLVSPFVIFARIAISTVPPWQIALALGINIASVAAAFIIAGRIYRVGMLLSGQLPSPRQIWAVLRA